MEVCTLEDYNSIIEENNIEATVAGMLSLLDDTSRKHKELENQKWYQKMIFTIFGKNKATVKEIKENHNKLDKYIAEAITELYNQNRISQSYLVVLGNRINELSYNNNLFKRNFIEITSKLNSKIESDRQYDNLIQKINCGMYDNSSKLVAIVNIINSCDDRVFAYEEQIEILRKSLSEKHILSRELIDFNSEYDAIKELPKNTISILEMQVSRISENSIVNEIYKELGDFIEKMCVDSNPSVEINLEGEITYAMLFELLVEDQKSYYSYLKNKEVEQDEECIDSEDEVKQVIDKTNCIGVYDRSVIPIEGEILPQYSIDNVLSITEPTIIEGKEVFMNAPVSLFEALDFDGCIVHINDKVASAFILSDSNSGIRFNNCLILSGNKTSTSLFCFNENSTGGFCGANNSVFKNCSNIFLYTDNVHDLDIFVLIQHSEVINCGYNFINIVESYANETDLFLLENVNFVWNRQAQLDFNKVFDSSDNVLSDYLCNGTVILNSHGRVTNCNFVAETDSFIPIIIDPFNSDEYSLVIEGTKFINCRIRLKCNTIQGCEFNNCHTSEFNGIKTRFISFSQFITSDTLAITIKDGSILNSKFMDISFNYSFITAVGNVEVSNCIFENCVNNHSGPTQFFNTYVDTRLDVKECEFIPEDKALVLPKTFRYNNKYGLFGKATSIHCVYVKNCKGILNDDEL